MDAAAATPWLRILTAVAIVAFLFWVMPEVILIVFAGCLFAVLLDAIATPIARGTGVPRGAVLAAIVLLLVGSVAAVAWAAGPSVNEQLQQLSERLPDAIARIQKSIEGQGWLRPEWFAQSAPAEKIVGQATGLFAGTVSVLGNAFLVFVMAVYLALSPSLYVRGALALVPHHRRGRVHDMLADLGRALRWWFVGRFASMAAVGVLTAIGLTIIGLGPVLVLALIAALFTFVPYLGPIAATVPALLVASTQGAQMLGATAAVYVVVQLIDDNVATPVIQSRAVDLPPALLIAGQITMGFLFGWIGVLLASPFIVAAVVAIQVLYVQEVIGEPVKVLGE